MSPEERYKRVQYLTGLGVPRNYHDAIIDAPTTRMMRYGAPTLAFVLLAVIIIIIVGAFFWLENNVEARAADEAAQIGATLIYVNVGLGPFLLFFGLLCLSLWAYCVVTKQYKVQGFRSYAATMLNPHPGIPARNKLIMKWIMMGSVKRAAARSNNIDGFLSAMVDHQARRWAIAAFALLAPAIVFTVVETDNFWVAGPFGVVEHRMFPPFSHQRYDLKDAKKVVTGCNNTDKSDRLIYDVYFASGAGFGLADAKPAKDGNIRPIEAIDAGLPRDVVHERWSHLDRNPVHPACLTHWAGMIGPDGPRRLVSLLRLTQSELRQVSAR
jgi:hypothetical protein